MNIEEFVFDLPLYTTIGEEDGYKELIEQMKSVNKATKIEGYNSQKKKESTFSLIQGICDEISYNPHLHRTELNTYSLYLTEDSVKTICFKCQRYGDILSILVNNEVSKKKITKVGQYPSVADIHIGRVKQYEKILERPVLREFTKAIGLAANGVGVGSFVYLRRIFEKLVYEAYSNALSSGVIDEAIINMSRMDEKIKMLNGFLPQFIVENYSIYGILSKGIHELSEEECLGYFDCMRRSIEFILDERLVMKERSKNEEMVKKTIDKIASDLK